MRYNAAWLEFLKRDDGNHAVTSIAALSVAAIVLLGVQHLSVWVLDDTRGKLLALTNDEPASPTENSHTVASSHAMANMVRIGEQAAIRTALARKFLVAPATDTAQPSLPNEPTVPNEPSLPNEPTVPNKPTVPNEPAVPTEPNESPASPPASAPGKTPKPKPAKQKPRLNIQTTTPENSIPEGSAESVGTATMPESAGASGIGPASSGGAQRPISNVAGGGFSGSGLQGGGFPGGGLPIGGFPGSGFPGSGFPGSGFPGSGFPGSGMYAGVGNSASATSSTNGAAQGELPSKISMSTPSETADSRMTQSNPGMQGAGSENMAGPEFLRVPPAALPPITPPSNSAMTGLESVSEFQFTSTGAIEIRGLDQRNPQRPKLLVVCRRAFRQLQLHAGDQRLAFNAPRPDDMRTLPLPPEWAVPGTTITFYGIESETSEELTWTVPETEAVATSQLETAGSSETVAEEPTVEARPTRETQVDDHDQQSEQLDDLFPSVEPMREE